MQQAAKTANTLAGFASDQDRAACRALIKTGSKSFYAASLLLPKPIRQGAYALYGFCRLSDDAVDEGNDRHGAVQRLNERLTHIYADDPLDNAADRCLADVVTEFAIPRALFDALLEGLQWDLDGRCYETLADTEDYAERVAASVGGMMAALMGARTAALLDRACDLGVAMQLTNIARDVGEDARNGRLYLPRSWLRELGVDPDVWLANPVFSPEIGTATARLLARADELYKRSEEGIANLPKAARPAIYAARFIYAEIGKEVAKQHHDSVSQRARTGTLRKLGLLAHSLVVAKTAQQSVLPTPDMAPRFLVTAVTSHPVPPLVDRLPGPRIRDDLGWLIQLFTEMEMRDRAHFQLQERA